MRAALQHPQLAQQRLEVGDADGAAHEQRQPM
jgi:hypothetical protein